MAEKWRRFTASDNPWSHEPAEGWRSKNWEIIFRPNFHIVSGLVRARYVRPDGYLPWAYFLVYSSGKLGWDWPERVPKYVEDKVNALTRAQAGSFGDGAPKRQGYRVLYAPLGSSRKVEWSTHANAREAVKEARRLVRHRGVSGAHARYAPWISVIVLGPRGKLYYEGWNELFGPSESWRDV
jgi:hypothetical protein